ncbi:hypothetical protein GSI_07551 [Ganoderma sinense ZZ0214-1]|uniref:Uncharacterized protein n=1 Tax=Ganoderma sinense ZZ0214-1 TaxID=1077348 RepID=A0A2G8S9D0_9APHY|nr:hypothetical protein GSI_07551 [Ganoderma sinense ZZ0214-1]
MALVSPYQRDVPNGRPEAPQTGMHVKLHRRAARWRAPAYAATADTMTPSEYLGKMEDVDKAVSRSGISDFRTSTRPP